VTFDGDLDEAVAPLSVTLVLDREVDISRGDLIAGALDGVKSAPTVARNVSASLVWMDQRPLDANRRYLLKHTSHTVPVLVSSVDHRVDLSAFRHEPAPTLRMNDIGAVSLHLLRPIAVDLYRDNRSTGALILIDPETNATVAAGMVTAAQGQAVAGEEDEAAAWGRVTAGEREARWGHRGGVLELTGPAELIDAVERSLFAVGAVACRIDADEPAFRENPQSAQCCDGRASAVGTDRAGGARKPRSRTHRERGRIRNHARRGQPHARRDRSASTAAARGHLHFFRGGGFVMGVQEISAEVNAKLDAVRATLEREVTGSGRRLPDVQLSGRRRAADEARHRAIREIPVLFLDTGYHFAETYAYRDRIAREWDLNLINLLPEKTVAEQEAEHGLLYQSAPDRCCGLRKVEPLFKAVAGYRVWLTGLRREQARSRAALEERRSSRCPAANRC
jgi:hypothetical protein